MRLPGCSTLRWSADGTWLAVPGNVTVAVLDEQLSLAATVHMDALSARWRTARSLDCSWVQSQTPSRVPACTALVVWGPTRGLGWFKRFASVSVATWTVSAVHELADDVRRPQWGYQLLAATSEDGLVLHSLSPSGAPQLLASLSAALPVSSSSRAWAGICSYAIRPSGGFMAVVLSSGSPASDLSLDLLDCCKAGAVVWSYTLHGTRGAASPGMHHVSWCGPSHLTVSITAGFLRRWHLSLAPESSGCCVLACNKSETGRCQAAEGFCVKYHHQHPSEYWMPSMCDMIAMIALSRAHNPGLG